jgi:hypothetical protein
MIAIIVIQLWTVMEKACMLASALAVAKQLVNWLAQFLPRCLIVCCCATRELDSEVMQIHVVARHHSVTCRVSYVVG